MTTIAVESMFDTWQRCVDADAALARQAHDAGEYGLVCLAVRRAAKHSMTGLMRPLYDEMGRQDLDDFQPVLAAAFEGRGAERDVLLRMLRRECPHEGRHECLDAEEGTRMLADLMRVRDLADGMWASVRRAIDSTPLRSRDG